MTTPTHPYVVCEGTVDKAELAHKAQEHSAEIAVGVVSDRVLLFACGAEQLPMKQLTQAGLCGTALDSGRGLQVALGEVSRNTRDSVLDSVRTALGEPSARA